MRLESCWLCTIPGSTSPASNAAEWSLQRKRVDLPSEPRTPAHLVIVELPNLNVSLLSLGDEAGGGVGKSPSP